AIFWMAAVATLSMIIKFAEVLLAVKSARRRPGVAGASLDYLFFPGRSGQIGGAVFCLLCVCLSFVLGGMIQGGALAAAARAVVPFPAGLLAFLLVAVTLLCVSGGQRRLVRVSARTVPLACLLYLVLCGGVLVRFSGAVPAALSRILRSAFSLRPAAGGVGGYAALRIGAVRGLLSNEAGCGTAPMAHATAEGAEPTRQGLFGAFEVFFDTVALCTLTGVTLLASGVPFVEADGGMQTVLAAFAAAWGPAGAYAAAGAVCLFAFSTVVAWSHYGRCALARLRAAFSDSPIKKEPKTARPPLLRAKKAASLPPPVASSSAPPFAAAASPPLKPQKKNNGRLYPLFFALSVGAGGLFSARAVWVGCDLLLAVMTAVNVAAVLRRSGEVRDQVRASLSSQRSDSTRRCEVSGSSSASARQAASVIGGAKKAASPSGDVTRTARGTRAVSASAAASGTQKYRGQP
ncbi:MAG: sodium:alanine symporter family protein, partial [Clostridia bacterium]|nr:sodium:alanine symporter family protein [Clostridia bacterium]